MLTDVVSRIEDRLRVMNLTASGASVRAGLGADAIRNIQRRANANPVNGISSRTLRALAPVLGVTEAWLLSGTDLPPKVGAVPPALMPAGTLAQTRNLPVFGLASGAMTGAYALSQEPVEYLPSPAALASVKDAYAMIVTGSSMEPRYFAGDIIWLHPHRPVRPGDHVAIQEERDGGVHVWVKRFDKMTDDYVIMWQYNPASEVKFARSRIAAMHRILTTNELMGV